MIPSPRTFLLTAATLALSALGALAKDTPVKLDECPTPVQATLREYAKQGTIEEIGVDKDSGAAVYEAKLSLAGGRRVEVHVGADGKVLKFEEKKAKKK